MFIGVSAPDLLDAGVIQSMAQKPVVFALANPVPEIMPEEAAKYAFVVATGRTDYPNQINNVLAFPGIFRGALDIRANCITEEMKLAAAHAIANCVSEQQLAPECIVPSVFDPFVARAVANAVISQALSGVKGPGHLMEGQCHSLQHQPAMSSANTVGETQRISA